MTMRPDLSIGQRLALGFGLLLVVLGTLFGLALRWSAQSAAAQEEYLQQALPWADAADELERDILYVGIATRAYLHAPGAEEESGFQTRVETLRHRLRVLDHLRVTPQEEASLHRFAGDVNRYVQEAERLVQRRARGRRIDPSFEAELSRVRELALEGVRRLRIVQQARTDAAIAGMDAARQRALGGLIASGGAAAVLFLALAFVTGQSVRRPTLELMGVSSAMERGDFAPALALAPPRDRSRRPIRDEMTRLGHALGAAAVALHRRERRLRAESAIAVAAASGLEAGPMASAALEAIAGKVQAELSAVYGTTPEGRLVPLAAQSFVPDPAGFLPGDGIPGRAARELRTVVVRDIPVDSPLRVRLGYDEAPPRCAAAVPITFRGELRGLLLVASLRDLDAYTVEFLESAARHIGIGLQNVAAFQQEQRLHAELREQHERIQAQNEELQAQAEEIQAQNEELQAQGEELQAQNEDLTRQGEELRLASRALAEADERKNEFLGVLAHELRNPLASVTASLHILRRSGATGPQAERALAIIDRQSLHLTRLIGDLLDVTRISRGKVRLVRERLDLRDVVRACADDHRAALDAAGLHLELELPEQAAWVDGDATRLHQVAGNLLGNAIKFTPRGGRILALVREHGEHVSLHIVDTGAGISPDLLPELFVPFRQGSTTLARSNGGLGLGLARVKALVDLHGGTVEARSDGPDRGAEFVVTLPRATDQAATGAASPETSRPPRIALRILVVEDNADAAESLQSALALEGHAVEIAATGRDGLERALEWRPDLVLCDIGLPHMDGYEVARALRANASLRSTLLVALSGYASDIDREKALHAGFDRHLAKPPDLDRLLAVVHELAELRAKTA